MSNSFGISLFVLSLSSGIVLKKILHYYKDFCASKNSQFKKISCISAPGKVLIAGGYLVLEHPNLAITLATSSRFYATVKLNKSLDYSTNSWLTIVVKSPQFYTEYTYLYDPVKNKMMLSDSSNPFVEKCILLTMSFIKQYYFENGIDFISKIQSISNYYYLYIKLQADNDFYSQIRELKKRNLPLLTSSLATIPKFIPCPTDEEGKVTIAKTGLGSSAALTCSLVGALLQWFDVIRIGLRPDSEDRRIVHNLSQLVHGNAQGKIGSGFDIAAATYGTLMYRRFSVEGFDACMEDYVSPLTIYSSVMAAGHAASIPITPSINALMDAKLVKEKQLQGGGWGQTIRPFSFPPGIDVILGDVCGGSSSPSMARKVLQWKRDKPEAENLWDALAKTNISIFDCIERLNAAYKLNAVLFNESIAWASLLIGEQWGEFDMTDAKYEIINILIHLRSFLFASRKMLKEMGVQSKVEIEPDQQTLLADATCTLPGVICAGVPGAGGYDALFAIVLSEQARNSVEKLWSTWDRKSLNNPSVCPLVLKIDTSNRSGIVAHFGADPIFSF